MIEFLFLDLDDTILDFQKAESIALPKTLREMGMDVTEEMVARYHRINKEHWQMLERGELTRDQVASRRFEVLFREYGIVADPVACNTRYWENLGTGHYFLPGAKEAVRRLAQKYRLFLASNGTSSVQAGRMKSADLYRHFEKVFVSEELGHNKPSKAYFDACFAQIPDFDPQRAMIVGDSLTSDIQGGINAGIATCWVNPRHLTGTIKPDYEIEWLAQLEALLESI